MQPMCEMTPGPRVVKLSLGHLGNGNGAGNGVESISGRGLAHRKMTVAERVALATDVATKQKQVELSRGQICSVFHVTHAAIRAEIKARNGNGNGHAGAAVTAAKAHVRAAVNEVGSEATLDLLAAIVEREFGGAVE
jgi:hypothetical protein